MPNHTDALRRVIDDVVAPNADDVDHHGRFPQAEPIDALGPAGILGMTSATEMGGGGQGLRPAAPPRGR